MIAHFCCLFCKHSKIGIRNLKVRARAVELPRHGHYFVRAFFRLNVITRVGTPGAVGTSARRASHRATQTSGPFLTFPLWRTSSILLGFFKTPSSLITPSSVLYLPAKILYYRYARTQFDVLRTWFNRTTRKANIILSIQELEQHCNATRSIWKILFKCLLTQVTQPLCNSFIHSTNRKIIWIALP